MFPAITSQRYGPAASPPRQQHGCTTLITAPSLLQLPSLTGTSNLKVLVAHHNRIGYIDAALPSSLPQVHTIDLHDNQLATLAACRPLFEVGLWPS